jgi:hypothetical protein
LQAIDVWTGVCLTFVFGALLEFALVNYASRSDMHRDNMKKQRKQQYESEHALEVFILTSSPRNFSTPPAASHALCLFAPLSNKTAPPPQNINHGSLQFQPKKKLNRSIVL